MPVPLCDVWNETPSPSRANGRLTYTNAQAADPLDIPECSPIRALLAYWSSRRKPGRLPGRRDLDPLDIPRLLPWLFLVDVLREAPDALDFRYRLIGTSNNRLVGVDATGRRLAEAFRPAAAAAIHRHYATTVTLGEPTFWRTDVPVQERSFITCFRGVFPLAGDGETVDMLAGMLVPTDTRLT